MPTTLRQGLTPVAAALLGGMLLLTWLFRTAAAPVPDESAGLDSGVVKIEGPGDQGHRVGSGFIVRIDGELAYILTAAHVVLGNRETRVHFNSRRHLAGVPAQLISPQHEDELGLALLSVPAAAVRQAGAQALPLSSGVLPGRGLDVILLGHPRTVGDWATLGGLVAAREGELLKVQASGVNEGSSGGPVLRADQVIGVVVTEANGIATIKSAVNIRNYLEGVIPGAEIKKSVPESGLIFRDCDQCPELVVIPAGSLRMGSPETEQGRADDEEPVHSVRFAEPFALGRREVSVGEFRAFVEAEGYRTEAERGQGCATWDGAQWQYDPARNWHSPGFAQGDNHPVVCVSRNDAQAYVDWLAKHTGKRYRLPSEAEWEYAARAGTSTAQFWGESADEACPYANVADKSSQDRYPGGMIHDCDDGFVYTAPIGSFKPNAFGLDDMLGNAWEWTADCWNPSYQSAPIDGASWTTGDCKRRVFRGGSWISAPRLARSAVRYWSVTGGGADVGGFRPARTL